MYAEKALKARRKVMEMVHAAGTSHIGSNLSCIDILTVLFDKLNLDAEMRPDRDRFVLSKGWAAASLYYFLAEKGVIPKEDLETYCKPGSKYIGLAEPYVKGVEAAGGAMGHGFPMAVGMALAAKRGGESWKTYCLMSDGEVACGTTWESALIAAHHKLNNLKVIIDYNKWQAIGATDDVLRIAPLERNWPEGWVVIEVDGHDHSQIEQALESEPSKPTLIIAHTVKGKGVSFMEDKLKFHYQNVTDEMYEMAMKELV